MFQSIFTQNCTQLALSFSHFFYFQGIFLKYLNHVCFTNSKFPFSHSHFQPLKSEEPANRPAVTDCLQPPALDQRQTGSGVMSPWERRVGGGVGVNIGLIAH